MSRVISALNGVALIITLLVTYLLSPLPLQLQAAPPKPYKKLGFGLRLT